MLNQIKALQTKMTQNKLKQGTINIEYGKMNLNEALKPKPKRDKTTKFIMN